MFLNNSPFRSKQIHLHAYFENLCLFGQSNYLCSWTSFMCLVQVCLHLFCSSMGCRKQGGLKDHTPLPYFADRGHSITTWKVWGEGGGGQKMSAFVNAQGHRQSICSGSPDFFDTPTPLLINGAHAEDFGCILVNMCCLLLLTRSLNI